MTRLTGLILFLFILANFTLSAQSVVIAGKVTDSKNEPIRHAIISVGNTPLEMIQVKTDKSGQFFIQQKELPVELSVQHFGYMSYDMLVTKPADMGDTLFIPIVLAEGRIDLEEIEVTASKISFGYNKINTHIIDYELRDNGMLLLLKEENVYYLRSIDNVDKTIFDLPIRKSPKKFFHDCMDNIHIMYSDSVYQVFEVNDSLSLLPPVRRLDIEVRLMPCVAQFNSSLVFRRYGLYKQSIDYVRYEKSSHQRDTLYTVIDRKNMASIHQYYLEVTRHAAIAGSAMAENSWITQKAVRDAEEELYVVHYLMTRPIYDPMVNFRDSVFLFDHFIDSAIVFDMNGKRCRQFPITHHYMRGWDDEIVVSEEGDRLFAKCERGGMAYLEEIDPDSGKILREIRLDEHIYPWRIQVRGKYIYYLYHHFVDHSINYIYKHRID